MNDQELEKLWLAHREAAFAHYGAIQYRAAMWNYLPPAAAEASAAFLAELSAKRAATHADWAAAWDKLYPDTPMGSFDSSAYEQQQRTTGHLQTAA